MHGNKITYKPINELNDTLNSLLVKVKHRRNPLHNKAHVFMEKAEKYNLNPIVLMGIALHESSRGSSLGALHKNNIGGIMGKKGLRKFNDIDACIEKWQSIYRLLQKISPKNSSRAVHFRQIL